MKKKLFPILFLLIGYCPILLIGQDAITFYDFSDDADVVYIRNCHGSGFLDLDNDGYDDIFIVHNTSVGGLQGLPHVMLLNHQDDTFLNLTYAWGVEGYDQSA